MIFSASLAGFPTWQITISKYLLIALPDIFDDVLKNYIESIMTAFACRESDFPL